MLKVTQTEKLDIVSLQNFPCKDLYTLNDLWLYYSQGRFSFSIQTSIWEKVGGKPLLEYLPRHWVSSIWGETVSQIPPNVGGLRGQSLFSTLAQKVIDCNIERTLPQFDFETVTVNRRGEIIQIDFFGKILSFVTHKK